jgi:hypothetical protein
MLARGDDPSDHDDPYLCSFVLRRCPHVVLDMLLSESTRARSGGGFELRLDESGVRVSATDHGLALRKFTQRALDHHAFRTSVVVIPVWVRFQEVRSATCFLVVDHHWDRRHADAVFVSAHGSFAAHDVVVALRQALVLDLGLESVAMESLRLLPRVPDASSAGAMSGFLACAIALGTTSDTARPVGFIHRNAAVVQGLVASVCYDHGRGLEPVVAHGILQGLNQGLWDLGAAEYSFPADMDRLVNPSPRLAVVAARCGQRLRLASGKPMDLTSTTASAKEFLTEFYRSREVASSLPSLMRDGPRTREEWEVVRNTFGISGEALVWSEDASWRFQRAIVGLERLIERDVSLPTGFSHHLGHAAVLPRLPSAEDFLLMAHEMKTSSTMRVEVPLPREVHISRHPRKP